MDSKLKHYLEKHNIQYKIHEHPAVFTVAEHSKLIEKIPEKVMHTKTLFLKDENNNFYLIGMYAHKRLDLKKLKEKLYINKKICFASPEQLKEKLNLTPGSVSIFGMINAKPYSVFLIIDKQVWDAPAVGFHPNINTATLELSHEELEKFYLSLNTKKAIFEI